jgi:hypothetical protein
MKARIINFPSKKELLKRRRARKDKESPSKSTNEFSGLNKILADQESTKEMFPPDYFMLVE